MQLKKCSRRKMNYCSLLFFVKLELSFYRNVLSSVTEMLDFNRGIDILDVGCGPGAWIIVNTARVIV